MKLAGGLLCLLLLGGCTSPRESSQKESSSIPSADELALAQKTNESLLSVIRILKPEAFEEVGLYRIEPGDTASKIARKHALRVDELFVLNPGVNWTKLRVWQVVRVRPVEEKKVEPAATAQHP